MSVEKASAAVWAEFQGIDRSQLPEAAQCQVVHRRISIVRSNVNICAKEDAHGSLSGLTKLQERHALSQILEWIYHSFWEDRSQVYVMLRLSPDYPFNEL